ncbi:uncharacterized protein [Panulirus ornatus]|uniref:uncharacterized protein isoform X2 n=1 Tax=Panulirus ornatus TaxID=150431 RepID=UPI003A8A5601
MKLLAVVAVVAVVALLSVATLQVNGAPEASRYRRDAAVEVERPIQLECPPLQRLCLEDRTYRGPRSCIEDIECRMNEVCCPDACLPELKVCKPGNKV